MGRLWWGVRRGYIHAVQIDTDSTEEDDTDQEVDEEDEEDKITMAMNDKKYQNVPGEDFRQVQSK